MGQDNTGEVAQELGRTVLRHDRNLGYGGNQLTVIVHGPRILREWN